MSEKYIKSMTGYKATNADMTCTPDGAKFQFELGKWYEHKGEIKLCGEGFHFCVHPSGPYAFYSNPDSRIFKIEAEQILEIPIEAGANFKLVAKRIRLVEEITPGYRGKDKPNDGNLNTGNLNTGDRNTGDRNTGDRNTGDRNTGDLNTGNWNTGDRNTGDLNTGNLNTGNWNTGNWNTGDRNTGNLNTGDRNTGDLNTGNWNTGNRVAGFFCAEEPKMLSFDVQTDLTFFEYLNKYPQAHSLGEALHGKDTIRFEDFKSIPGITPKKLEQLHKKHLAAKKI